MTQNYKKSEHSLQVRFFAATISFIFHWVLKCLTLPWNFNLLLILSFIFRYCTDCSGNRILDNYKQLYFKWPKYEADIIWVQWLYKDFIGFVYSIWNEISQICILQMRPFFFFFFQATCPVTFHPLFILLCSLQLFSQNSISCRYTAELTHLHLLLTGKSIFCRLWSLTSLLLLSKKS